MKKCPDCENEIEEKYARCLSCNEKKKKESSTNCKNCQISIPAENTLCIPCGLSQINNNLYALRTILEFALKDLMGAKLVWNKEKKLFEVTRED